MSSDFIGFGMNDESLSNRDLEQYKGKTGFTDRISLCWLMLDPDTGKIMVADPTNPDPKITPKFKSYVQHYVPGLGYILPVDPYTTERFGPAKPQVVTLIVKYVTDKSGNISGDLDTGKIQVMLWKLSVGKFNQLKNYHAEFNLTCSDLRVSCKEEKFQQLEFVPCQGKALWQRNPEIAKYVLAEVRRAEAGIKGPRAMTVAQIQEKLGEDVGPAPETTSSSTFDDLMDGLE